MPVRPKLLLALLTATIVVAAPARASIPGGIVSSENVEWLHTIPTDTAASSVAFASDAPIMYVSTFRGLEIWDISDPVLPTPIAVEPLAGYQNEAMSLGERPGGEKFVLFASNQAAADSTGYVEPSNRNVTVVEVTDPADPTVVGHVVTPSRTHTASCVNPECTFAYSDGRTQGEISIVDLRDFRDPKLATVPTVKTVVPQGHDQDLDDAGVLWHVGGQGSVALDVTDPEQPRMLNSTSPEGNRDPWNRFIHHNSYRPNAGAFRHLTDEEGNPVLDEEGRPTSGEPSLENGNVLLVTEEFLLNDGCPTGDEEGAFQTWHVPFLDADEYAEVNPTASAGRGTIRPLDRWNTEIGTGTDVRRLPGFCSAHYFDFHATGVIAQGWYEQGVRFLDVRDPADIKQVGYFMVPGMETWGAYWVPEYGEDGKQTGEDTNVVYSADNTRGIDILRVDLESLPDPEDTEPIVAPILPSWFRGAVPVPTEFGFACREVAGAVS